MRLLNTLFFCLIATSMLAQKPFEGRIVYRIKYEDMPDEASGLEKMLPSELLFITNGTASRSEQQSVYGGKQVFLNEASSDSTIILVDILEQKLRYAIPIDQREKDRYLVTETEEEKDIKGFKCKKAVLQTASGVVLEVWYDPAYENPEGSRFPQVKGLPLQYEVSQNGMRLKFTARSVKQEAIDDTYFAIPEEYEATSRERFNRIIRQ